MIQIFLGQLYARCQKLNTTYIFAETIFDYREEMFYLIAMSLISSLLLKMAFYVLGYWVGIHFYSMVPQFSTVFFVFSQIWN